MYPVCKTCNISYFILQVWHEAPFDLQRSLYEHFFELLTESRYVIRLIIIYSCAADFIFFLAFKALFLKLHQPIHKFVFKTSEV